MKLTKVDWKREKSGRQDLNLRPLGPQPSALPDYATPRLYASKDTLAVSQNSTFYFFDWQSSTNTP